MGTEVGGPGTVGTVNDEVRSRWRTEPAYVRHGPKPGDERRAAAGITNWQFISLISQSPDMDGMIQGF